jgi:hypothetical protein
VDPIAISFRDIRLGERILGLRRNAVRAVQAGYLTEAAATPGCPGWERPDVPGGIRLARLHRRTRIILYQD